MVSPPTPPRFSHDSCVHTLSAFKYLMPPQLASVMSQQGMRNHMGKLFNFM